MYKVILVDDEILVRDAIKENINWVKLGFELVTDCQNGKEAIQYLQEHDVDLVLTDICMPFVDGMELCRYLHEHMPNVTKIIFSGFSDFQYAKEAIKYGVSEYLLKPITAFELTDTLTNVKEKMDKKKSEELEKNKLRKSYQTYRRNKDLILSNELAKMVKGIQSIEQSLKEMSEFEIDLQASYYRIGVVEIDWYSELYEVSEDMKKECSLMNFVVDNISNEILEQYHAGLAFQEDNIVFLMLKTNKPMEFVNTVSNACREIQEKIFESMKLTVSIGIGGYVKKLEDLHSSYDQALQAISYRYLIGEGILLDMEQVSERIEGTVNLEEYINKVIMSIKNNDSLLLENTFGDIRRTLIEHLIGQNRVCLYLQQIIRGIMDHITQLEENGLSGADKENDLMNQIANSRTFEEAFQIVKDFADEVSKMTNDMKHTSGTRQAMLAIDYIKQHYGDSNLNLNSICSYLCISTSHFSTIFKEASGFTFMEVLTKVRMEKAMELLENTTLKNYEIADRVGFSYPHYFSIAFKKMTGKSPTEYAKEKRKIGK